MIFVEEFTGEDRLLLILVRVERSDTLLGRSEFLVSQALFFQTIELSVPRKEQRCTVRDLQVLRCDRYALGAYLGDLLPKIFRIQRYAVSENIYGTIAENT